MDLKTKKCPKCGWGYPPHSRLNLCKFCGAVLSTGYCKKCEELSDTLNRNGLCHACARASENTRRAKNYANRSADVEQEFNEWVALVRKVPKNYPTVTQKQWLEVCAHFDGCAICGSHSIDARTFFISAADGGRYCDWNIIPMCEDCAKVYRKMLNPFRYMYARTNPTVPAGSRKRLKKAVDYLRPRLEVAINDDGVISKET